MTEQVEYRYVTQSELKKFRQCPLAWKLAYLDKLAQPPSFGGYLKRDRGTIWHKQLEARYLAQKDGLEPGSGESERRVLEALNIALSSASPEAGAEFELQRWMYQGYSDRWNDRDLDYEIHDVERIFEVPMPVPGAPNLVITGKIDLVTRNLEGVFEIWDHKSVGQRDVSKSAFVNEMLLEDQFPLYQRSWNEQFPDLEAGCVIYDAARTDRLKRAMTSQERFHRETVRYNQSTLDEVWADNAQAATALVRAYETGEVYSVPNPRNCSWGCDFYKVHLDGRATGKPYVDVAIGYGFVNAEDRYPDANRRNEDDEW